MHGHGGRAAKRVGISWLFSHRCHWLQVSDSEIWKETGKRFLIYFVNNKPDRKEKGKKTFDGNQYEIPRSAPRGIRKYINKMLYTYGLVPRSLYRFQWWIHRVLPWQPDVVNSFSAVTLAWRHSTFCSWHRADSSSDCFLSFYTRKETTTMIIVPSNLLHPP